MGPGVGRLKIRAEGCYSLGFGSKRIRGSEFRLRLLRLAEPYQYCIGSHIRCLQGGLALSGTGAATQAWVAGKCENPGTTPPTRGFLVQGLSDQTLSAHFYSESPVLGL